MKTLLILFIKTNLQEIIKNQLVRFKFSIGY